MTGDEFEMFCAEFRLMMIKKNPKYNFLYQHVANKLGVQLRTVATYKSKGAGKHIALACAAILAGLNPYGEEK